MTTTWSEVTAGFSSRGEAENVRTLLKSLLALDRVPAVISVRYEGSPNSLEGFQFQQIARWASLKGVTLSVSYLRSTNVRDARDWLLETCPTKWLWMLDDDVIPESSCLSKLMHHSEEPALFIAGSKPDVANLRDYPSFCLSEHPVSDLLKPHSQNWVWTPTSSESVRTQVMDTGNCLFDAGYIRSNRYLRFRTRPDHGNCSGDDMAFSLRVRKAKLSGLFVPSARAWHMDKASNGFGEIEARREMLLRLCDSEDLDVEFLKSQWMGGWKTSST